MGLMNKFPSYDYIIKGIISTFKRFPLALICAIHGTIVAVSLISNIDNRIEHEYVKQKLLMVFALAIPLFIALTVLAEKNNWKPIKNILIQFAGLFALAIYYIGLPENVFKVEMHIVRFLLLFLGTHCVIAFAPFLQRSNINGFWQFNKSLFLRLLLSVLYSGVMYTGLTIALAAADYLFGVEVKPERYLQLWAIMAGIFHTWLFLAGVPQNIEELNSKTDYPKGLKIFTQYILLPLVLLYFAILITYEAKIIFEWNWPKGWVSQLVLWYSIVGMVSLLLLYPLREKVDNKWIQVFIKWFFRALIPLVIMLFFAIGQRISEYGMTENRYFVLIMAIALAITTIYFVFGKAKDIRIIPILLCIISFLSAYGPQSAFSISKNSQTGRLNDLLIKTELLVDGEMAKPDAQLEFDDQKEISSIVRYLSEWHGTTAFNQWLDDSTLAGIADSDRYGRPGKIATLLGFVYVNKWDVEANDHFYFTSDKKVEFDISKYDIMINFQFNPANENKTSNSNTFDSMSIHYNEEQASILIDWTLDDHKNIDIPLGSFISSLKDTFDQSSLSNFNIPWNQMMIKYEDNNTETIIFLENVNGEITDETVKLYQISGTLLIDKY